MKRILLAVGRSMPRSAKLGLMLTVICLAASCSYFQQRNNSGKPASAGEAKVSKAEYDALLAKYRQALGHTGQDAPANATNSAAPELAETVDVFQNGQVAVTPSQGAAGQSNLNQNQNQHVVATQNKVVVGGTKKKKKVSDAEIERQIMAWRKAARLVEQQKYDQALTILRPLEKSSVKQIHVRTRFLTAEILYAQHEYDLAFQVYEEIIQQDAFSALVLPALGKLVACADKLNLTEKKEQYYSLLHDVFGEKAQP